MARGYGTGTYGRVGGRRSGGGAWQWLIIGGILGMGCSAIFVFGLLTLGVLNIEGTSPDDPVVALQNTSLPQPTANLQATVDTILNATLAAMPTQAPLSSPTEAQPAAPQVVAPTPAPAPAPAEAASAAGPAPHSAPAAKGPTIDSPMVGTFYSASNPDSPPFVKPGDSVTADTVVCIVEAMKVFNEIKAEKSGKVKAVLVNNGDAVEFGQPLFELE